MFVFLVLAINDTLAGFVKAMLSSCKAVLDAIKFKGKPSCIKMDFCKVSIF